MIACNLRRLLVLLVAATGIYLFCTQFMFSLPVKRAVTLSGPPLNSLVRAVTVVCLLSAIRITYMDYCVCKLSLLGFERPASVGEEELLGFARFCAV